MVEINLPLNQKQTLSVLATGQVADHNGRWVAHAVREQHIVFRPTVTREVPWLKGALISIRAISLTATFMPALACLLLMVNMGQTIDYFAAVLAIIGLLFLQIAVNLLNDVGDYYKLIDLPGTPGGSGVIQQGWFTAKQIQTSAWVCLILGAVCGLPALIKAPDGILFCGVLGVIGVIGYSGKPFNFKYRALGDVAVFLLCGPVLTMGMSYAATGELQQGVLLLGAYFGFAGASILNANNISDIRGDEARGAKTFASVLGFQKARFTQGLYYGFGFMSLLILMLLSEQSSFYPLIPFMLLPLVWLQLKAFYGAENSWDESLTGLRFEAAKLHLLMGVSVCMGLVLNILFA